MYVCVCLCVNEPAAIAVLQLDVITLMPRHALAFVVQSAPLHRLVQLVFSEHASPSVCVPL